MADDGEAKVVRGASLLILLQVVSRAITFVANQLLLRFMTAQLLGISTQLEVYYLSVLFFARESLRVAIQRQGSSSSNHDQDHQSRTKKKKDDNGSSQTTQADSTQAVVNLGYIAIILGLITATILGGMYLTSVPEDTKSTPNFAAAVYLYALASVLELLSEPAFVVMQIRLQFTARARAEALATFVKCFVTLSSAVWASRQGVELGVLPFALGQIAYGLGLLGVYTWYGTGMAGQEGFSLFPRRLGGGGNDYFLAYFYRPTLNLASSMMVQSFVKHLLTQGDTFLVSILSTPTAQGVYALANNYGGLVARLIFQPVEESSRSYFSRLLSNSSSASSQAAQGDHDAPHTPLQTPPPTPPKGPSLTALHQASADLTSLLQAYVFVSLPLVALGPVAAPRLLSLVAGPQWTASGAGDALAAYVYYIPLLALNGLTEAFVASVATEAEVHVQSVWMMGFSFVFALAGWVLMHVLDMGAVGLVAANGINMACRIVWAVAFIRRYFAAKGTASAASSSSSSWEVSRVLPSPGGVGAAVLAASVVRRVAGEAALGAEVGFQAVVEELVKIAAVAVPFLGVLAYTERRFLIQCYETVRGNRTQSAPAASR